MRSPVLLAVAVGASALACACPRPGPPAAAAGPATAAPPPPALTDGRARVPRQYLVTLAAGSGEAAIREVYGHLGIAAIRRVAGDVFLVILSEDPGPEEMEALGRQDARVRAVQPNFVYRAL